MKPSGARFAHRHVSSLTLLVFVSIAVPLVLDAEQPIAYRFSFPEPEHHWMQVEARFSEIGEAPLELRMSRSSPGRYAIHDFAKNVYDVRASDPASGNELPIVRSDPHGWRVVGHAGSVVVRYKVFGDRVDGTYLAIDPTHAHINMPAAIMWARGPSSLHFEAPAGSAGWRVATQLYRGSSPFEFTAPNLQYLMDSPVEFGPFSLRQLRSGGRTIRIALHQESDADRDLDAVMGDLARIVQEHGEIFGGDYPEYETGEYTFIVDYLSYASGDAMEHRNSSVLTAPGSVVSHRTALLGAISHEFFHGWNVERIRPSSLEPFDFERANMSGELWLAEGFTQYYGLLVLSRAGLAGLDDTMYQFLDLIETGALNPALRVRSAEEMSRMAPFTDGERPVDRTNWPTTVISYYSSGGAIALALDLTLRARTDGRVSLDDYMRAMWRAHGKPGGRPGYVDRPYSIDDAEARLAEVSGDVQFARDFFARYIRGREAADYARLLHGAGFILRPRHPNRSSLGDVHFEEQGGGVRVAAPPAMGSPAYVAGLDVDVEIRQVDGKPIRSVADLQEVLARRKPGDEIGVTFVNRTGKPKTARLTLAADAALELLPVESTGGALTSAQKRFRQRWLN
jgi:predicted metalloprotease with PDZ domain